MSEPSRRIFLKTLAAGVTLSLVDFRLQGQDAGQQTPLARLTCPILMYHYISTAPEDADRTLLDLTVPPEQFEQHLDVILEEGYQSITMDQLYEGMHHNFALPEKPVVLTFDDGYWDAAAHATPLMRSRGMVGTFYIVSEFMETSIYLKWGDAAAMQNSGMEIGCHSATHPDLSRLSYDEQFQELESSTLAIENALGRRPTTFCYPFGRHNLNTRLILRDMGYKTAVTTSDATVQYADNRFRMGRVRVRNRTTLDQLRWLLNRAV